MTQRQAEADRYALVGHPVHHSRSPLIHQLFARQTGEDVSYELIDANAAQFEVAVKGFRAAGGKGLNVTVPHKEAAYQLADDLGNEAELAKAVNTLTFENGRIRGDNTDGIGFMQDLTVNLERSVENCRVLILGAGGAARGIVGPLLGAGPAELWIANRTLSRAEALQREFGAEGTIEVCSFDDLAGLAPFDLVVNATSAGLKGEQPPFPKSLVDASTFCYDLAYSLKDTPFVEWARTAGAGQLAQGWGMLVEQAAASYFIWRGKQPRTGPILSKMTR
jgi:shikimate dehydrogenase